MSIQSLCSVAPKMSQHAPFINVGFPSECPLVPFEKEWGSYYQDQLVLVSRGSAVCGSAHLFGHWNTGSDPETGLRFVNIFVHNHSQLPVISP